MSDHEHEQAPADCQHSTSRRDFIKTMGVAAAAAGGGRLATGRTEAAAATPTADGLGFDPGGDPEQVLGGGEPLALDVVDYVDGYYVLDVRPGQQARAMWSGTSALGLRDGIRIEVTAGRAEVRENSGTGAILLKALPGEAVRARAVAPAGTAAALQVTGSRTQTAGSEDVTVGFEASEVSQDELGMIAAGGGACVSSVTLSDEAAAALLESISMPVSDERLAAAATVLNSGTSDNLVVRAAVLGNVVPRTPTDREINWRHARYYGMSDAFGLLRFTYNNRYRSAVTIKGGRRAFFPAAGVNRVYCLMEALELGITAFNVDPMVLPSESFTWPAYSTPMNLANPVTFYNEAQPEHEVMTIVHNEMKLYDYNGVDIRRLGARVSRDGVLSLGYEVRNQTDAPLSGRWLLIGDHADAAFAGADGELALGPAGRRDSAARVDVTVPVAASDLTQRVGFAVMSLSDPIVLGITPYSFRF